MRKSVKMWGVFCKGSIPCKPSIWNDKIEAENFRDDYNEILPNHVVRLVTVSWTEGKSQKPKR